jgi:hypothetical protein
MNARTSAAPPTDVYVFDLHIPGVPDVYWHAESLTEAEVREHARRTLMFNRPGTRCVVRRAGQPVFTVRKRRLNP